jgi:N-acyl-L-homoserine lactone synthetase
MSSNLTFTPSLILDDGQGRTNARFPLELKVFTQGSAKRDIYALRYRAYMENEYIAPRNDGLFFDEFDELDTSYTIGAFDNAACVGSLRLTFGEGRVVGSNTMPCQEIFPEIGLLESRGFGRIVEFTRMAVEPELTNTSFKTTLYATLIRAGMILAHANRADYGVICVHPEKAKFYQMIAGFKPMAEADNYPGINAAATLLGREFRALNSKGARQNPFFRVTPVEIERARKSLFAHDDQIAAVA